MCVCEFCMMDVYSFDIDKVGLEKFYEVMYVVYCKVFDCMGFDYCLVLVDIGVIGGNGLYEFYVLVESGEDLIVFLIELDYVVNIEKVEVVVLVIECLVFM